MIKRYDYALSIIKMPEKNELDKYRDEGLYDLDYEKDDICKIVHDDMILHVVGKLHAISWV